MSKGQKEWGLLALIWFAAMSCRSPIIGVAPILPMIIEDLDLSYAAGGFLFSLPVLLMGLLAIPGGLLADRFGPARVIGLALLVLAAASVLRAAGGAGGLFAATALLGGAIGVVQPALPRVVRERFAGRIGFATAVYSTGFTAGSLTALTATAAWLLPLAGGWGWRGTFAAWSALAGLTAIGWRPYLAADRGRSVRPDAGALGAVVRDPLLWRMAVVQMTNSGAFYTANAWLTAYYQNLGWPLGRASVPLALFTAVGAAAGFLTPIVSDRMRARRPLLLATCYLSVASGAGLLFATAEVPVWIWSLLFGVGLFGSFTIGLALPVDVSPPARVGAGMGFVLTIGYVGALSGPFIAGYLRDVTGGFAAGIVTMLGLTVVMTAAALAIPETYGWSAGGRSRGGDPGAA